MIIFIITLIVPAASIAGGLYLIKYPPQDANAVLGYRTKRSKQSVEAWAFAQTYSGRIMVKSGVVQLIFAAAVCIIAGITVSNLDTLAYTAMGCTIVQVCMIFPVVFYTERALKQRFDAQDRP